MKKILLIIPCILLLILMSCDRRTSKKEHLENAISEFNKNLKLSTTKNYYPNSYTEIKIDSIVAKTFTVSIKNYSSMTDEIFVDETVKAYQKTQNYHRVFESDVLVVYDNKIIYDKHLSAKHFRANTNSSFWNNATLEYVWVNQERSNEEKLTLDVSFINPNTKAYKLYELRIDNAGNERLTLIEEHSS